MRRLLLRLLLACLVSLVAAKSVLAVGGLLLDRREESQLTKELHAQKTALAVVALESMSPAEREGRLHELHHQLHLPMTLGSPAPPASIAHRLSDGTVLHVLPPRPPPPRLGRQALELLLSMFALLGAMVWVGRPLLRDLERVENAAEQLSLGDLDARSGLSTGPIGALGSQLDTLADQVQETLADQSRLLAAVSHEIRTPLARMRFQLESLTVGDHQQTVVAALDEELENIDVLVTELLALQRLGRAPDEPASPESTRSVIEDVCRQLRDLADVEVRTDLQAELPISARDLQLIARNLVGNALRHANKDILVRTEPTALIVEDDGAGVPEHARALVFQTFASLDPARTHELGGVGLGLALVKRAAERWGATATVDRGRLGGARFVVRW